jgi:hypothetical protein
VAGLAAVALLAGTAFTTSDVPPPRALDQLTAGGAPPAAPPPVPLRVLVVGDQLAASTQGTLVVADADGDDERRDGEGEAARPLEVTTAATADCGLALGGHVRLADGSVERDTARCGPARDSWVAAANEQRPDVVAVWAGLRDVADRRFEPDEPWRNPSDPALVDFLRGQVADLLDQLSASGAPVAVLTVPYVANAATPAPLPSPPVFPDSYRQALVELREARIRTDIPPPGFAENDPARIDQWNALLREVAASRGIPVVDVAAQLQGWPEGPADPERRAGGVGLTAIGGAELAPWLSAQLSGVGPVVPAAPTSPSLDPAAPLPEPPPVTPRRRVPAGRPVSAVVVGDSVGFNFGTGLDTWARRTAGLRPVNAGKLGCSVARGGTYRFLRELQTFPENCDWSVTFPRILDEQRPDVAVLVSGVWEVVDRRLPGEDRFRHIGDPGVDRYLLREWLSAVDVLGAGGATVVLVTYPHFEAGRDVGFSGLPESDPARVDRLNELIREVAALRPGVAQVLDFQAWLASQPGGELDPAKRDDGLHFRDSFLPTIGAWLGPQLISLGRTGSPTPG